MNRNITISAKVSENVKVALQNKAQEQDTSVSSLIAIILSKYLFGNNNMSVGGRIDKTTSTSFWDMVIGNIGFWE